MTAPYGSVWEDTGDGEVVMVIDGRVNEVYADVLVLVPSDTAAQAAGLIVFRSVQLPQWKQLA